MAKKKYAKAAIIACIISAAAMMAPVTGIAGETDGTLVSQEENTEPAEHSDPQPEPQPEPKPEPQPAPQPEPQPQQPEPAPQPEPQPQTDTQAPQTEAQTDPSEPATEQQLSIEEAPETETVISQTEGSPQTETQKTESESEKKKKDGDNDMSPEALEEAERLSQYSSNAELISAQQIAHFVKNVDWLEYRFEQVDGRTRFFKYNSLIREGMSADARVIGTAEGGMECKVLERIDDWCYIESGSARGFVRRKSLFGKKKAVRKFGHTIVDRADQASITIPIYENEAFTYRKITTREVLSDSAPFVVKESADIYDDIDLYNANVTGSLSEDNVVYIIENVNNDIVFVESGKTRGFMRRSALYSAPASQVNYSKLSEIKYAKNIISPKNNRALYYSLKSADQADPVLQKRKEIVEFALQFVGNPYVWGGTSLTNGADCSGFAQSVYAHFGYSIPRVACDQACYGRQIPLEDAQPGDLVFYASNGYVFHTAMYIGDGMTVQAGNSRIGIVVRGVNACGPVCWATNILE